MTCSGHEPSSCLTCDTNRTKDASGHCVWFSECSLHSYMDQNKECQECHKLCHRCFGPEDDHCLSCIKPYFLLSKFPNYTRTTNNSFNYSVLISYAPRGKFSFSILMLCLCPSDTTCVKKCPVGYYAEDKDERMCERCHFSCKSCIGRHSVQCNACKPGFFKQESSCVETCSER